MDDVMDDDSDFEEFIMNVTPPIDGQFYPMALDQQDIEISETDSFDESATMKSKKRKIISVIQQQPIYIFRPYEIVKINSTCPDGAGNISTAIAGSSTSLPVQPSPRSGHRTICTKSDLFCLGGFNPRRGLTTAARRPRTAFLFQELWRYNFVSRKWKLILNHKKRAMPEELASNAITIHNNVIIAHGGTGYPFGENCSNESYIFCTNKPYVKRIEVRGDMPTPMYGPAIVVHNNKFLYTIGGTTGFDYSCDVFRLDLQSKYWEQIYICRPEMRDDDPKGRYRHEIVYDGKYIYILGGGTSTTAFDLKSIPAFNLELNKWVFFKTNPDNLVKSQNCGYPAPRKCYSCVQYVLNENDEDKIIEAVIAGGYGENETYYSDIWKLNFNTFNWNLLRASLPNPTYFHSASSPGNGCMYLFGGIEINGSDLIRTNDLYKIWTTIPNLSEICFDAICYYNSKLDSYTKKQLLKCGIPQRFVDRVSDMSSPRTRSSGIRSNDC